MFIKSKLIVALDTSDLDQAVDWARAVAPYVGMVKIGLQLFTAHGPFGVKYIYDNCGRIPLFLDLKLHDIPNTVYQSVRALEKLNPTMLTIHAAGSAAMIQAAADAIADYTTEHKPKLIAVTVLSHFDNVDLAFNKIAPQYTISNLVEDLARQALLFGTDGLVCAPHEIANLRQHFDTRPLIITAGVRPDGAPIDDQNPDRVMTPDQALAAGADYIVIGRPITKVNDPVAAARLITRTMGDTHHTLRDGRPAFSSHRE